MTDRKATNTLHLIFSERGLGNCLATLGEATAAETLLLLQDAVYAAVKPETAAEGYLVLAEDLALRGIADRVPDRASIIDRAAFVDLTATHSPVVSWS